MTLSSVRGVYFLVTSHVQPFYIILDLLSLCCQFAASAYFLANSALSFMGIFPCSLLRSKFVVFSCLFI